MQENEFYMEDVGMACTCKIKVDICALVVIQDSARYFFRKLTATTQVILTSQTLRGVIFNPTGIGTHSTAEGNLYTLQ